MYKLALVFCAVVAAALAQADKYPAGVAPALCPNYPHCDNALLAAHATGAIPYAAAWAPQGAAAYPAGVSPASCPNYPYCGVGGPVAPLYGYAARQYPAGVHPAACPNYPYC